jgi:hypothetical protein
VTTLVSGQTYQLRLTAPGGTVYQAQPVRDGAAAGPGFSPQTVFADGYAQYTTDGASWTNWDTWGTPQTPGDQDLELYFAGG